MHEAALAAAALPAPARVLGLMLRPYCLGHELWLIRENNPLAVYHPVRLKIEEVTYAQLMEAALICHHRFEQVAGLNRDRFIGFKIKLWTRRTRGLELTVERERYLDYRIAGTGCFPTESPTDARAARHPGTPLILRVHQFLMLTLGLDEATAWNYPMGLAYLRFAGWLEGQGMVNVKNEFDLEFDAGYEEFEREQAKKKPVKGKDA